MTSEKKQIAPTKLGNRFNTNTDNNPTWLTPPSIIKSLGVFDLDPCTSIDRPWDTALHHYTIKEDGLLSNWFGRVWCNPPYGRIMIEFLEKMAVHNNGISLVFARTDTAAFHKYVFPFAESIFFLAGRIFFHDQYGMQAKHNSGAPSVLISYGEENSEAIDSSGLAGFHVRVKERIFIAGISLDSNKTWRVIVGEALEELKKDARLSDIYEVVVRLAPSRVSKNKHYKEKIRQVLQSHYERIAHGVYTTTKN